MSNFSKAVRKSGYWYGDGPYRGSPIRPNNGVIHTTEGTSLPTYSGGATAPQYTAVPDFKAKRLIWVPHFPDEQSARALRNESGGVETNTLNCIQIELVGTCDRGTSNRWGTTPHIFWPEAPEWALRGVAEFVADMYTRHAIPMTGPPKAFASYPGSYGVSAAQRMSFSQWSNFEGWSGHQHVPENSHGDPGNIKWALIEKYARELIQPEVQLSRVDEAKLNVNQSIKLLEAAVKDSKAGRPSLSAALGFLKLARRALGGVGKKDKPKLPTQSAPKPKGDSK